MFFSVWLVLIVALLIETKLEAFYGASLAQYLPRNYDDMQIFLWSSPENKKGDTKSVWRTNGIEQHDELKTKIRDRAGKICPQLKTAGCLFLHFSFSVFSGALEVIDNARMIVLYLSGYLLFQVIAGIVILIS